MKKKWEKPSLRVIVRSKPEEAVLTACKYDGASGAGALDHGCRQTEGMCVACPMQSVS